MDSDQVTSKSIKDSGKREEFATGSQRDTEEGKGRPDLLPILALVRLSRHFEEGCKKYGERNWESGQPLSRYWRSAQRHMWKYLGGAADEDHLAAVAWNIMCLMDTEERIKRGTLPEELDDLPRPHLKGEEF